MVVLVGKSFHGLDISAYSSPELGKWVDCLHWQRRKEESKKGSTSTETIGVSHFCLFLLYERDLAIQKDLEYLTEAVFVFYTKHLDKFIRENDKLWGDFCKRRVDRHGNVLDELELDTRSYDMTIPGIQVPMNKKTVIPEPERHFSFPQS